MSTPPPVWRDPYRVRSYEIAPDGLLTLPTLCNYLQESAGNHATAYDLATDTLLAGGIAWVLARLTGRGRSVSGVARGCARRDVAERLRRTLRPARFPGHRRR